MKRANLHGIITYTMIMVVMFITPAFGSQPNSYILKNFVLSDFGDGYDAAQSLIWKPTYSEYVVQAETEEQEADANAQEETEAQEADANEEGQEEQAEKLGQNPDPERTGVTYAANVPLGVTDLVAGSQKFVLGVKGAFIRRGYNWIELRPFKVESSNEEENADAEAEENAQGDEVVAEGEQEQAQMGLSYSVQPPTSVGEVENAPDPSLEGEYYPIPFFGVVSHITLWAWGGNYGWWVETYITDYAGYQYRFPMGDLMYRGWRQKRVAVPDNIAQTTLRLPSDKGLIFDMLKLWSFPSENVIQFYAYFDLLQYESTVSTDVFNGSELERYLW